MATAAAGDRTISIGRVFERAFGTIRQNPVVTLGIALVIGAIPGALMTYMGSFVTSDTVADSVSGFLGLGLLMMTVSMVISALVQGALTRATIAASEGRAATFGDSLSAAIRVLLPLIGLGLLFGLGVALGAILLLVPGIILAVMWSVGAPALVVERQGVLSALSRSRELTKGARWKIFAIFLVLLVAYWLLSIVAGVAGLASFDPADTGGLGIGVLVGTVFLGTVFNAAWGTILPSLYLELREWKEGVSADDLEEIFA